MITEAHKTPRRMFKKAVQQGRSERGGEEVHTALRVGRSPSQWVLANGKAPTAFWTPEKLLLKVEPPRDARTELADFFNILLGACPTLTFLLRRTIRDHLRRSRPEKILNVFQRIHLRFFQACGLASGRTSLASSRPAMLDRLLGFP